MIIVLELQAGQTVENNAVNSYFGSQTDQIRVFELSTTKELLKQMVYSCFCVFMWLFMLSCLYCQNGSMHLYINKYYRQK